MTYWQIAAGSRGRDYSEHFLRYGIAFVGGGEQEKTMTQVREGHRVLLKMGMKLRAVGCVVSRNGVVAGSARTQPKTWLRDFDGWDLPAFCYADWHPLPAAKPIKGLTQSTIEQVRNEELQCEADKLLESTPKKVAYDEEPSPTKDVQDDEIIDYMVSNGFPVLQAEELALALRRVRRLASYYYHRCNWELIKEHETRSFLVVPLLQALGWAEQQMKIEFKLARGRVDLALFREPFTGYQNQNDACIGLLETKGFPYGLDYVKDQAENYAKELTNCRSLFVTNGFCYKIFQRKSDKTFVLSAYLNVLTPRDRYPLDPGIPGCLEAITQLLPRGLNSGLD